MKQTLSTSLNRPLAVEFSNAYFGHTYKFDGDGTTITASGVQYSGGRHLPEREMMISTTSSMPKTGTVTISY